MPKHSRRFNEAKKDLVHLKQYNLDEAFERVKNGGYIITITKDTSGNTSIVYDDATGNGITPDPSADAYWANLLRVTGDRLPVR